jgi:hypothetical protein
MHFLLAKRVKEASDGGSPTPWRHGGEATRRPPTPVPSPKLPQIESTKHYFVPTKVQWLWQWHGSQKKLVA